MVDQNKKHCCLLTDCIFKTMYKESESFRELLNNIFIHFFEFDLRKFKITSEELTVEDIEDTKNRVDLLLELEDDNYLVNIEANRGNKEYYPNRNLMYVCKIVVSIVKKASNYKKKFRVVQININDIIYPLDEEIITTTLTLRDNEKNITDERMKIHNLYLGKYKKLSYNELNEIERDLKFLICEDIEEMKKLTKGSKLREKIMSEYKRKISDKEFLEALFDPEWDRECIMNAEKSIAREEGLAEGLAEGRAEGFADGKAEGENKRTIEIATNLLKNGMSKVDVMMNTNLSIKEIEKILGSN